VALLVVAACGEDPSLHVIVDHPDGSGVAKTVVTVYESATASCGDIEYGLLDEEQLQALAADEQTIEAQGKVTGALDEISRTERKLIVARGFDADDRLLTAQCAQHDVVEENDEVEIVTVLAATVSVSGTGPGSDTGIEITVTDPSGLSIARRDVAWRVFAPIGTEPMAPGKVKMVENEDATWQPAKPPCTNNDGRLRIFPVQPDLLGGFAFSVNASWSTEPPRLFASFTKIDPKLKPLDPALGHPGQPLAARWCTHRVAATPSLVCVEDLPTPGIAAEATDYVVTSNGGRTDLTPGPTQTIVAGAVAVYGVDRDGGKRDVYAVASDGRVVGLFSPTVAARPSSPLGANEFVSDAIVIPKCAPGDTPKLLIRTTTTDGATNITGRAVKVMDAVGGPITPFHGLVAGGGPTEVVNLNAAGCVTELAPGQLPILRPVAVVDVGRGGTGMSPTKAYFDCNAAGGRCTIELPVGRSAVGFIPGEEPRMVGPFFDASGTVLSAWVMLPDASGVRRLVERERIPAASFPQRMTIAQLDDDGEFDLLWSITNAAQDATSLQVAYSRKVVDQRLSALTGPQELVIADLFTGDITGDGHADVVLYGRDSLNALGVAVIPTHVSPPGLAPPTDNACD
jgi:hypothetical protein